MKKYLVTFNWYRRLHMFYNTTKTFEKIAIKNAKIRLSKKLGIDLCTIDLYLSKGHRIKTYKGDETNLKDLIKGVREYEAVTYNCRIKERSAEG